MTATPVPGMQIAIDCARPHELARFWADVMHYEVEDQHDGVMEIVAAGMATFDDTVEIDGRRAWRTAAACRDPHGVTPRLLFQEVPEPKAGKNRVHLDLHVVPGTRDAEVRRLMALGATRLWDGQQGPTTWVTMADPEGNEFCVT